MVPKLYTSLPTASILQGSALNVTNLYGFEVQQLQQLATHILSLSYHKSNSINVAPPELTCVLIPPAPQDEDEIC